MFFSIWFLICFQLLPRFLFSCHRICFFIFIWFLISFQLFLEFLFSCNRICFFIFIWILNWFWLLLLLLLFLQESWFLFPDVPWQARPACGLHRLYSWLNSFSF
uniref:Uncharacterized protein n=1 Tax=Cacopsylla melanoneura TaxID=428564 RepID=A0A8D8TWI8_9HEMI